MFKVTKNNTLPHSEVELHVEASFDEIIKDERATLLEIRENLELPGFRKGNVPESMVIEKVGDFYILEKTSQRTLNRIVPEIILAEKLNVIAAPSITITKLARDNQFEFTITVPVMPSVTLPDYKSICKKHSKETIAVEVSEEEVENFIISIRKQRANADKDAIKQSGENTEERELPELDDAFVKSLGNFESVDDFKKKVRENMLHDKEYKEQQKIRLAIVEEIIENTTIDLPHVLIENELDKMQDQFSADIRRMGLVPEDYLKHLKKTWVEIRSEWKTDATKRAKLSIILSEIAFTEKIIPDPAVVAHNVDHVLEDYKHENIDRNRAEAYVQSVLSNEMVFQFLEKGGIKPETPAHVHAEHNHE